MLAAARPIGDAYAYATLHRRPDVHRIQAEDNKTLTVSSSSAAIAGGTSDVALDIETVRARLKGEIDVETRKKDGLEKMLKVAGPKEKST